MPSAQKPAGAEDAERALSREQPVAADPAPTPANQGSASAEGAEFIEEDLQQDPPGNGDLLRHWRGETNKRNVFSSADEPNRSHTQTETEPN